MSARSKDRGTLLLVEHDDGDARHLREALGVSAPNLDVRHVATLAEAAAALAGDAIDVALVDLALPDASGVEIVRRLHEAAPEVPIVVLTGLDDDELAVRAVQEGAQDFFVEGRTEAPLLARALRYAIERKRAEEAARKLSAERVARLQAEALAARLGLLAEVGRVLTSSLEPDETTLAVARLLVPQLGDACFVDVLEEGGELRRLASVCVEGAGDPCAAALPLGEGHPARDAGPASPVLLTRDGVSVAVARLTAWGRAFGSLALARRAPGGFSAEDLTLVESVSGRIALALDNARLARAREDVMAIVSHDLRNPLSVVAYASAALRRGGVAAGQDKQLDKIDRAVSRMNRLLADLLDVSRIEAGRLAVQPARVVVAALVTDAIEAIRGPADEKSIVLDARVPQGLPGAWADRERVLQVLGNLLGNAIKFTPEGGAIAVAAEAVAGELRLSVRDSGPGIAEADLPRVFDRFWQGARPQRQGAGLGLAIAKGIVSAHGGRIWVESRPGAGTALHFTLPIAQPEIVVIPGEPNSAA